MTKRTISRAGVLAVALLSTSLTLVSCTAEPKPHPSLTSSPAGSPVQPVGTPKAIAIDLSVPWSMLRLSTGSTLVSERETALVKEIESDGTVRVVGKVPGVVPNGEGGLLGLAARPGDESWLYAYETTASDNRVIRMPLTGGAGRYALGARQTIVDGLPFASNHDGGRIKFGPDGDLYITVGDANQRERAQDIDYLGGKILRVTPAGDIPADNPFPGSPVWSYGHRNPQGIAWDGAGTMWAAEFGQDTWDELNIIQKGSNYGWPIVEGRSSNAKFTNPQLQWRTDDASPSGLLCTHDTLFLAALQGQRLWTIYPTSSPIDAVAYYSGEYGRLRDVIDGPSGTIWVLTNNTARGNPRSGDDRILQIRIGDLREG